MGVLNGEGLFGLLSIALGGVFSVDGVIKYGLTNFNGLRLFFGFLLSVGILLAVDDAFYNERHLKKFLGMLNLLEPQQP